MTVAAIIVAGGTGERFGSAAGKQLAEAAGRPLLSWSVAAFERCSSVDAIIVVAHPDRLEEYAAAVHGDKLLGVVAGGETRQDSVANGLAAIPGGADVVAVHDGARPLVVPETIASAVALLGEDGDLDGAVVGHPMFDTVKRTTPDGTVIGTLDRSDLWVVQTPQVFRARVLRDAYARASAEGFSGTDDASLVEHAGGRVRMVTGPRENIKVTVAGDLAVVEAVLRARGEGTT